MSHSTLRPQTGAYNPLTWSYRCRSLLPTPCAPDSLRDGIRRASGNTGSLELRYCVRASDCGAWAAFADRSRGAEPNLLDRTALRQRGLHLMRRPLHARANYHLCAREVPCIVFLSCWRDGRHVAHGRAVIDESRGSRSRCACVWAGPLVHLVCVRGASVPTVNRRREIAAGRRAVCVDSSRHEMRA